MSGGWKNMLSEVAPRAGISRSLSATCRLPAGRSLNRWGGRLRAAVVAGMALSLSAQMAWSAQCKPHHFQTPYFIKTMGRCVFDQTTLSFHDDGVEQARCLMRGMDETRNLGPQMAMMPAPLADRVGNEAGLPTREALSTMECGELSTATQFAQFDFYDRTKKAPSSIRSKRFR